MKKTFIIGMAMVAATSFVVPAYSAPAGAKSTREMIVERQKTVREAAIGAGKVTSALSSQEIRVASERVADQLGLTGADRSNLIQSVTSDGAKAKQRLENIIAIAAVKKQSESMTEGAEKSSLVAGVDAAMKLLSNSALVGGRAARDLSRAEQAMVGESLTKLETIVDMMLTRFDVKELNSYVEVINKYFDIMNARTADTAEEAFVQAIMQVKKVNRASALEIAKKLKECV